MAPIIIVGTGLAGYSLAREFRKLDKETPLLLISQDDGHSYSKPMLSTGFTKQKTADELSMADPGKMAEQLKASVRTYTQVERVDPENKLIVADGDRIEYSKLVLATGANVNRLSFPGSDHEKVLSVNDLMDYRSFRSAVEGSKQVLIMGAGLIGCEYANDLLIGGYSVTVADPSPSAMNGLIPGFAGDALVEGLRREGATIKLGDYVEAISEHEGGLKATLHSGEEIEADLVLSAVGLKPNIALAQEIGIECNRGIVTNRRLETSQSDIYALGDCAEVDGHVLLYVLPLMAGARALAKTLAGTPTEVNYGVMPVMTKTPACPVVVSPPLVQDGEWRIEQNDGGNIKALYYPKRDIDAADAEPSGFVLTGDCVSEKQALSKLLKGIHG